MCQDEALRPFRLAVLAAQQYHAGRQVELLRPEGWSGQAGEQAGRL